MRPTIRFLLAALSVTLPPGTHADSATLARNCAHCHGVNGVSSGELIPNISGQKEAYLKHALAEYKQGKRPSLFMGRLAKGYTDQELESVAAHFAQLKWTPVEQTTDARLVEVGHKLAQERCAACHGDAGGSKSGNAPYLGGQWSQYLKLELERYLNPQTPAHDPGMKSALAGLGGADIDALAQFYAAQR
jgi:sulfide dehydrogenase cytochrome subunit